MIDLPDPNTPKTLQEKARRWWEFAKRQLREEMPKSAFDEWVEPIRFQEYRQIDDRHALFVFRVPTPGSRIWLNSRVKRRLERLLSGHEMRYAQVEFVLDDIGSDAAPQTRPH